MCDPLTIGSLALSAAGTAYNTNQQAKNAARAVNARNEAAQVELARQQQYQDEAGATFADTLGIFGPADQRQGTVRAEGRRVAASDAALSAAKEYKAPVSGSAPKIVSDTYERKGADARTEARDAAARGARLQAPGDLMFNNRVGLNAGARGLGTVNDFSGRSAALLPFEQQAAAQNSQKAIGPFGDILKLAGSAGSLYGATGGGVNGLFAPQTLANPRVFAPNGVYGAGSGYLAL